MKLTHRTILDILRHTTEERPISLKDLATNLSIGNGQNIGTRKVKTLIQELRRDHHQPIGHSRKAGQSGYYMIRCPRELRAMIQRLRYEANSRHITANKMEKALTMQAELF